MITRLLPETLLKDNGAETKLKFGHPDRVFEPVNCGDDKPQYSSATK